MSNIFSGPLGSWKATDLGRNSHLSVGRLIQCTLQQLPVKLVQQQKNAATRKTAKYSNIQAHHIFQPVAVESLGPINASGRIFLSKLGRKPATQSDDDREISFLFQRLSVLIQRYNAILLHDYFVKEEEE